MLHQRAKMAWMKGGDQCSRIFFRRVAKRRASNRVFQITNSEGQVLTNRDSVISEFTEYFRTLLGGTRRQRVLDMGYLRPLARHVLSDDEALALIQPVTPNEIKTAVFDIDEVKAPGPDGYSSGFFKAAWPIVGEEVTRAGLGVLPDRPTTQTANAHSPGSADQPISECIRTRSFYWRQSCWLKNYFRDTISNNLPPRCALKVDLRKAYDTVEWDFLSAVLTLFGFPPLFISWIEECVTTASFSVCVNGAPHGYFPGARGLQQGDPMSPYLFVLAMEVLTLILNQFIDQDGGFKYHWRCEDLRLFQLGFADDLLLFSKADLSSVHLFKRGLLEFADLSGLQVNPQKSHIILSRSAAVYRDMLLPILGYQEGHLPLWYLGFPLLASRLTIADCKPILQKIDDRIRGWDGIMLSFAGRLQLIKSVLTALQVYWAMAFILPKSIIREIEKRLRSFLWKGSSGVGYAKVSWQQACRPVEEGGLGLRDLLALNRGLMSRHLWRVIMADRSSIWVDWVIHCRLRNASIWTVSDRTGSWSCRKLVELATYHGYGEYDLPAIHGGRDRIIWTGPRNSFSSAVAYDVFCPPGPKVD
ncbi:UNVERIFIED_CONTAM: Retrovirus-related Pol polyprotein from type-2 retrotransposable element R2DM, partial [Sesamum radiatum]